MTAETSNARGDVVAERQAWYEQQIALAEGQWAAAFLDRWECGDDVPSKEHYVALWLAERSAPQPADARQQGHLDRKRFERAPCYLCGYNGEGYYQPDKHPCAARYHAQQQGGGEVNIDVTVRDGTWVGTYAEWCRRKQTPPPSAPVGAAEDMVLDAIERRESSAPVELRNAILEALNLVHAEGRARVESATAEMADRLAALAQRPSAVDEAMVERAAAAVMSAPPGISVEAYVRIVLEAALATKRQEPTT